MPQPTIREVSDWLQGELSGDGSAVVTGISSFEDASSTDVVLVTAARYLTAAGGSAAGCVITPRGLDLDTKPTIAVDNPKLALARLYGRLYPATPCAAAVHPSAVIDPGATVDPSARVGPQVVIEDAASIGPQVELGPGVRIGAGVHIGRASALRANVVVYPGTRIGERVLVHAGAVLGCDGFGFVRTPAGLVKFPQMGQLVIGDDVEIGANATVDRGALGQTRIERGTKIDNQVQIGHNVLIGCDCALSAQVGIAGSSRIGDRVTLGGQVGIGDHVTVGDEVMAGGQAGIPSGKRIRPGQILWGTPAKPLAEIKRQLGHIAQLEHLRGTVRELEAALADLRARLDP